MSIRPSLALALPCALLALHQDPVQVTDPLVIQLEELLKSELEISGPFPRINIPHLTITRPEIELDLTQLLPQDLVIVQEPALAQEAAAGPRAEPPLRARIQVGDEVVETVLGQEAQLADGTKVTTSLLDERVFSAPGAFDLSYPRDWQYLGAVAQDGGWWTLRGDGEAIYLRAHAEDADVVLEQYVSNLEGGNKGTRKPLTITVDGVQLKGWSVEIEVGSIGTYEGPHRWVQEVFAWHDGTRSWLLSVQRDLGLIHPVPGYQIDPALITITLDGQAVITEPEPPKVPGPGEETLRLLSGLRWFQER